MVGKQWGRTAFALLTAMALVASPLLVGVASAADPVVTITSPPDGTEVSGTNVTVTAIAVPDAGQAITQVQFLVDGDSIGTDTDSAGGWTVSWDTTTISNGSHNLTAIATDDVPATGPISTPVSVTVNNVAANTAPTVSAGPDRDITLPASASLAGSATDDGLPNPPGALTYTWSKVSGPGNVTFAAASNAATTATFTLAGTYVLELSVTDGAATRTDTMTVNAAPANTAPTVSAGPDRDITLPASASLAGSATDDGLPNPPGALTYTWSKVSGPGNVTFAAASNAATTATFTLAGTYVLELSVTDGAATRTDTMTVNAAPANTAPTVSAGPDRDITLPASASLAGSATDDGLPNPPGALTYTWSKVSGPGNVTFAAASNAATTATFTLAGTYVLELSVTDGAATRTDTMTVNAAPANTAPTVSAGPDRDITLPASASLAGSATDDGLPNPPGALTYTWSKVSGPGNVTFAAASNAATTATFTLAGTYVLELSVTDGAATRTDTMTVNAAPANTAPTVSAGPDRDITLPASASLAGSATDDGLPNPPGALTYTWSKVSGPGNVTFAAASNAATTATFTLAGTYVLELSVTDGAATRTDTMTVAVNDPPTANAGGPYSGSEGNTISVSGSASSDSDGSIVSYVWNWGDGTTDTTTTSETASHRYSRSWIFTITLTVTDDDGATDSDTATASVASDRAPTVAITTPTGGAVMTGPLTLRIQATDPESGAGTLTVQYRFDGVGVWQPATYNTFTQRYEATVGITTLADGPHSIIARATDGSSNTSTSSAVSFMVNSNKAPTARISSPIANALVSGSTTISVVATDDKAVSRVDFLVDGVTVGTDTSSAGGWTFVWDTTKASSGRHSLTAKATDAAGATGTSRGGVRDG